jgi:gliding motility-associated-like protein
MKRSFYLALLSFCLTLPILSVAGINEANSTAVIPSSSELTKGSTNSSPITLEAAGGNSIVTQPISGTFCSGSAVVVNFTTSNTSFALNNVFTAQLSDGSGSFAAPTNIGNVNLVGVVTNSYIYAQIPSGLPFGSGYRIRVISSNPSIIGSDNGADITIKTEIASPPPTVTLNGPSAFCFGSATTFISSSASQGNLWFPGGINTNPFIGVVSSGCYYTQVTSSSSGCTTTSIPACIQVNTPIFTFLGYFENGTLATTVDTTITICEGDSAQMGVIIEGGVAPYDIFYTPDGFNFVTVNDVGTPSGPNSHTYTFYTGQPGFYQIIGITDNFPTNCGSNGNSGLVTIQTAPRPVTDFSYLPFCGPISGSPVLAESFLAGGDYSFDVDPADGATINPTTGIISNAVIGNTYIIRYTVQGQFCEASSTTEVTVNSSDVTDFSLQPFCSNNASDAPIGAPGFATGGTYAFEIDPADGASVNALTGIITNAQGNTTYTLVYTSPVGVCQANSTASVTTFESPSLTGIVENTLCGQALGSITVTASAGAPDYSYLWSGGETTPSITGLVANAYTITVTDENGCTADSIFSIINTNEPELDLAVTNATCGNSNGAIDLTLTGGSGDFEFAWTPNSETTEDISGLDAGSYSVQVTDLTTTCVVNGSATIIIADAPLVTFESENSLCGQSIGSIDVTVDPNTGSGAVTHSWSNGMTTEDISGLEAGVYIDTITDEGGCEVTIEVTITNSNQFTASSSVTNPTCAAPTTGAIDVSIVGGTTPFTYSWTPNTAATTQDVSGLAPGTYTVSISDGAGCIASVESTIAPLNTISLVADLTTSTCGNADGAIDLTVNGGSGDYTFVWSNAASTEDVSNLEAGVYNVSVTDQADVTCTASGEYTIINGNQPIINVESTNTSCISATGSVSLEITGGSSNFEFAWTGPDAYTANTQDISGLSVGSYSLTLTDNETSCVVTASASIQLDNPPSISATVVNTTCGQNNGLIDVEVTGGTAPLTVLWSNAAETIDQINLSSGEYSLTITDDNGCSVSATYTIAPSVQPQSELAILNPSCGNDTGSVVLTLTGAISPITYSWTFNGSPFANTANISNLAAGIYILTANDGSGCVVHDTASLVYPNQPILETQITNTQCGLETGAIDLTVTGGSGDFTFFWDDSFGFTASTEDIADLAFGCYTVTVTDANGCEVSTEACIENDNAPIIDFSVTNASCNLDNGSITANISGGVIPYSLSWTGTVESGETISDLAVGTYYLLVIDDNGCETIDSVAIINTGIPALNANQLDATCGANDGSIDLIVSGGQSPYTFIWSPNGEDTEDLSDLAPGDYSVVVTDNASCEIGGAFTIGTQDGPTITFTQINPECGNSEGSIDLTVTGGSGDFTFDWTGNGIVQGSEDQSGLTSGLYTVVVTDNQGACSDSVSITISNSNSFEVTPTIIGTTCGLNNGSVSLAIVGGTEPFTYTWCDGSSLPSATSLSSGSCQVTISDGSGCTVILDLDIPNTPAPSVLANVANTTCGNCDGSIELVLTGAASPVSILWNSGASNNTLSDLCAGEYSAVITDANGCSLNYNGTVGGSSAPVPTATQINTLCGESTGSIDVTVESGLEPYTYNWNGPNTIDVQTEDLSNLEAGVYTLVVTDASTCTANLDVTIVNTDEPVLVFNVTDASCGATTGSIDLVVTNTSNVPTFSWTGPDGFTSVDEDLTGVGAGTYNVEVTSGSCVVTGSATINNADAPSATLTIDTDTLCAGVSATLTFEITGTGPFTFTYSDGTNNIPVTSFVGSTFTTSVSPTASTTYTMISLVSDNDPTCAGNVSNASASVVVNPSPNQPTVSVNGPLSFCEGGSVVLTSSSATGNIWSQLGPDQLNQSITVTESGVYSVEVTNSFGCTSTSEAVEVIVIPTPNIQANADTTVCAGQPIFFNAIGGSNLIWSPSIYLSGTIISNPVCTPFASTTYIVSGSNLCGASADTINVTVIPTVNVDLGADILACPGEMLNLSVEEIDGASYEWTTDGLIVGSDSSSSITIMVTNTTTSVSVSAINTNDCVSSDTIQINLNSVPTAPGIIALGETTFCDGDSVILQASTGNFVVWSNGLENFDEILVTTSGSYYVTSVDGICPSTSDTIVVTVQPLPSTQITTNDPTTLCEGACATLTGSASNSTWIFPDASTSNTASIQACTSGLYILENAADGCVGRDTVLITILPNPVTPIITLDGPATICENQFVTLISSFATGNQWQINGVDIIGETGNTLMVAQGGLYNVQVTNAAGCTSVSAQVLITVKPISDLAITAVPDTIVCGNIPVEVALTASNGFITYNWTPSGEGQSITATSAGLWSVTATNQDGCVATASVNIIVAPEVQLTLVSPVLYDDYNVSVLGGNDGSIDLSINAQSNITGISWAGPSNYTSSNEDIFNLLAGQYVVSVTDEFGCITSGDITLKEPSEVVLPNGYTPNGDGFNDFYVIKGIQGYPENQVNIFNRWGSLVFSAKGYVNNWNGFSNDGNVLPDGTYFIVVDLNVEGKEVLNGYIDLRRK